jgi:UDP-glucose 4-epimerase
MGRRVLITGLGTYWGGRLAQALEADPSVDAIIGLDTREPTVALERTEYVRCDASYSILARLVRATQVDTILHTFLVVDSGSPDARSMHEINVIGTLNLVAAAGAPGSTVRTVVVKSSSLVYGSNREDPTWFREDAIRSRPARTRVERSLLEVESYVADLVHDHPEIAVSVLRFSNVFGPEIETSLTRSLDLPAVPCVFGFDPRFQLVHEADVVRALQFAMDQRLRGTFNVAGDGLLPWSEMIAIAGKRPWPLPPVGTDAAARMMERVGWPKLPPETLELLRHGRGIDTSRIKAAGFGFHHDTVSCVESHVGASRLHRAIGSAAQGGAYRYERDVEAFFRHSPSVVR